MEDTGKSLFKSFTSATIQFWLFKIAFLVHQMWQPLFEDWHLGFMGEVLLSIIAGVFYCWFVRGRPGCLFGRKLWPSKRALCIFFGRVLAILCAVALGFLLDAFRVANPMLPSNILLKLGMSDTTAWGLFLNYSSDAFENFFFNPFSFVVVALFPCAYAVVELFANSSELREN